MATPIPAATMLLVRESAAGMEVLMMRRSLEARFMPGVYVFPGGALNDDDYSVEMQAVCDGWSEMQASNALGISRGGLAYWIAAIRETFEEAGILMACDGRGDMVAFTDHSVAERYREHRDSLNQGQRRFIDILRAESLLVAADRLVYFSHWVTPESAPRRFDTRFFVTAAPKGQEPVHDQGETIDNVWIGPGEALARHQRDDFPIRFPTIRTLEELAAYSSVNALTKAAGARRDIPCMLPRITKDGRHLLPGDPGYNEP